MTIPATDAALRAFEHRPTRSEAMADLARHFRNAGMNEAAAMFAHRGLAVPPSGDLLFVEGSRHGLLEDLSISGFYSVDPATRREGAAACEALAFDRDAPSGMRDLARSNYHHYLRPIADVFASWKARRLTFAPPDGYAQMAPSVTRHGSRLLAAQRCINYGIDGGGYYQIEGHKRIGGGAIIHTRTLLLEFDPETLAEAVRGEITMRGLKPHPGAVIQGFEDSRLFEWCGELWTISTVLDQNPDGRAEQWLARLAPSLELTDARPIFAEGLQQPREKNWMPVVDSPRLRFVYACDPTTVLDESGRVVFREPASLSADHLRGGSQLIPFADGWLAVVHWVVWFDGWPKYRHRLAWFDRDIRLRHVSPGWVFAGHEPELDLLKGYEYCTGMCWHPDSRRLVVGFQVHEREAWIGALDAQDALAALGMEKESRRGVQPSRAFNLARKDPPARPQWIADDESWVLKQTNRALGSAIEVDYAIHQLEHLGLPLHHSRPKNWDSYLATWHCRDKCAPGDRVLDAGGDRNSAFLPSMARLGYLDLGSINLEEDKPETVGGIAYRKGDIIRTGLPSGAFSFIACLSVLEHGVDCRAFLDEAARLLAPGGHLFISVDYWESPVSTKHVVFLGPWAGQRWEIFTPSNVEEIVTHARDVGLIPVGDVDRTCRDRVASHLGCNFTFLNLLLRR